MLICLIIKAFFLVTILLNYFGKRTYAQIYFPLIFILALSCLNILFGPKFGSEFGFFPLIILTIIFFRSLKHKILWFLLFSVCYFGSSLSLQYNGPISAEQVSDSTFYLMFITSFLLVFIMSLAFIKENERFESQTIDLLDLQNKNNKALENSNKELAIANNELEKFAYVASHDLKTPLRNINSFLNLIQRKLNQGKTDEINEYLEFARINAQRMHGLIQDVLEFSQVNRDNSSFSKIDLNEVLNQAILNLQDLIIEKNVIIEKQILPDLFCNKSQIISLFQNLIENGIKYNESPSPKIKIKYLDNVSEHKIFVSDNGIGIEKEYLDKVFEMFYRLHNQGEYVGTGIGLASCRKIVTYHGGTISIESTLDEGSTFCIALPKHSQDETFVKELKPQSLAYDLN